MVMRFGVFGLGRSGLAVARAAKKRGDEVVVFDQKPLADLAKPELYHDAVAEGIDVRLEWDGELQDVDALVTNPAVPRRHPILVHAAVPILSEIEFAYRISTAPIVAITGTNGKSTSTVMTWLALRGAGVEAILCGNIYGSGFPETTLTDAASNSAPDQILVAEVSSFQLEWVTEFRPVAAGITNVTSDHLDRYDGKVEDYAATKRRIFAAQTSADYAVVELGQPKPIGPQTLTFGLDGADAVISETGLNVFGHEWDWTIAEPHNRKNAALSALLAHAALKATGRIDGFDRRIFDGLAEFHGLGHRMQLVGERDGVRVINNSMCTNPDAVMRSIDATGVPTHALIGGVNKGLDFSPVGRFFKGSPHRAYLFGRDRAEIAREMAIDVPIFETMQQAFVAARDVASAGEVIMLSPGCASMDQFRDFVDRGNVFTAIAKEWLRL